MAHFINYYLLISSLIFIFFFLTCPSFAQQSFKPKALVLPITKDASTHQYLTHIHQRTPLVPLKLVVDLGGRYLWVDCEKGYVSSTHHPARCGSNPCSLINANGCGNNTCGVGPGNPIINLGTYGEVGLDVVSLHSTDGTNPRRAVRVPSFIFACAPTFLLKGLASGATGMAGFGRAGASLPSQFAAAFGFPEKFVMCLSNSSTSPGVMFFGDGPYIVGNKYLDFSEGLIYTPLYINPVSTAVSYPLGERLAEYFINIKAIHIESTEVALNKTLLSIYSNGVGGTKISTVDRYTVLETSIFKSLSKTFIKEAAKQNITRVKAVKPFKVCFSDANVFYNSVVGPHVLYIYVNMEGDNVTWLITGSNSVVKVKEGVLCLAFIDGGSQPRTSIAIGGFQLENNFLQFDLVNSRVGFSSTTILGQETSCSNFNFTTVA